MLRSWGNTIPNFETTFLPFFFLHNFLFNFRYTVFKQHILASRRWCFTLNNPKWILTETDFKEMGASYLVYQEEIAPTTGTHHLQGYVEMPKPVRFTHFTKDWLEGANFRIAKGTPLQASDYCKKEESRLSPFVEFGVLSQGQGQRNDLLALRDAVRSGKRGRDLFDDDEVAGAAIRYNSGVNSLITAYSAPLPRDNIRVVFCYGPAGTGKTRCAHSDEAYYYDGNGAGFLIGYKGEKTIIMDEFSGSTCSPLFFQRLCDRYPLWLNVKGGQVPCNADTIRITSNYLPSQWWSEKTRYNQGAIYRRIHEVHYHDALDSCTRLESDEVSTAMDKLMSQLLYVPINRNNPNIFVRRDPSQDL